MTSKIDIINSSNLVQSIFVIEGHTCQNCSLTLIKVLRSHPKIVDDLIEVTWLGKVIVGHFDELAWESIVNIGLAAGISLQFQLTQPLLLSSNLTLEDEISISKRFKPKYQLTTKLNPKLSNPEVIVNPAATLHLFLETLKCSIGAQHLEFQLNQIKGILNASLIVATQQANIMFNPSLIDGRTIKDKVAQFGYPSKVISKSTIPNLHQPRSLTYLVLSCCCCLLMLILKASYSNEHIRELLDRKLFMNHPISLITILKLMIALISIVFIIVPRWISTIRSLVKTKSLNTDSLVSFAIFGHVILCLVLTFQPNQTYLTVPWEETVYFITLLLVLQYCESSLKQLALVGLHRLTSYIPTFTTLITKKPDSDQEMMLETSLIKVGDIVKVIPDTRFPGDGEIIRGTTTVDETILTGKSTKFPVKSEGDDVIGGTLNVTGMVWVKIRRVGVDSTLHQIVDLVQAAQENRSKLQNYIASIASLVIPSIIITTLITCVGWVVLSTQVNLPWPVTNTTVIFMGISMLVIINPCGLGLAIPIPIMVACGIGAKSGLLVRGGDATLGATSRVNVVVFDKTGTLTRGKPVITDVVMKHSQINSVMKSITSSTWQEEVMLWEAIILLEEKSNHPLARAIISYSNTVLSLSNQSKLTSSIIMTNYEEVIGLGVRATMDFGTPINLMKGIPATQQYQIVLGSFKWLQRNKMTSNSEFNVEIESNLKSWEVRGKTTCLIGLAPINMPGNIIGGLAAADTIRPESQALVKELQDRGMEVWMLSGDSTSAAKETANKLGIVNVIPEVLPNQKADRIKWLQNRQDNLTIQSKLEWLISTFQPNKPTKSVVAMVGDGINDSLALAQADLSIALGNGHDLAINQASVILLNNNLTSILSLIDLSKSTLTSIRRNLSLITIYTLLILPIVSGLSLPLLNTTISLPLAILLQGFATLSILISSLIQILTYHPTTHLNNTSNSTLYSNPTKSIKSKLTPLQPTHKN